MIRKVLPAKLETIEDAKQAFDAIGEFLNNLHPLGHLGDEATGHAVDGAWCLAKVKARQAMEESVEAVS